MNETQVLVRAARYRDGESVRWFLNGLSPAARYKRFFTMFTEVQPTMIRSLVTSSPRQLVLVALDGDAVIGHAMAVCVGEHTVDLGIVVADAHRRHGVGDRLMHELIDTVARHGVTEVHCDVLSDNYLVLQWMQRLLPDVRFERSGPTVTAHGHLAASAA